MCLVPRLEFHPFFALSIDADKSKPGVGVSPSLVGRGPGVPVLGAKKIVSLKPSPESSASLVVIKMATCNHQADCPFLFVV